MNERNPGVLEERIAYRFRDKALLTLAMTHTSWVNEHREAGAESNERLEFLGDAVLDFAAAEYLYRKYPALGEGKLSTLRASMVSEKPLAACARDLELSAFLRLGHGEELSGGRNRDSILSDALESLIGAVFLDGGFEAARDLVVRCVLSDLRGEDLFRDRKTPLQEILQDRKQQVRYEVVGESGPDHDKRFTVAALVGDRVIGTGTGRTKKAAAQMAAEQAISAIGPEKS